MKYAKDVLEEILQNIAETNVTDYVRRAELILQEIESRDFTSERSQTEEELNFAIDREEKQSPPPSPLLAFQFLS